MYAAQRAYPLYLVMRSTYAFAFALVLTYELAYHAVFLALTPLQLVFVGVVLESMTIAFEIPTGMFADLVSRRLSVIIGILLTGLGFLTEALIPSFTAVLIAQVLWGIGFTFYSGAEAAWIVDEIGAERAPTIFLRATQLSQGFTIFGTLCGALFASHTTVLPIIVGASIFLCLGVSLCFTMAEDGFHPLRDQPQQSLGHHVLQPLRMTLQLVRIRPLLRVILVLGVLIGVSLGGFDRLYTPHVLPYLSSPLVQSVGSVTWLGLINTVVSVLSLIGTEIIRRRYQLTDQQRIMQILFGLYSGMIIGSFAFALSGIPAVAIAGFCLTQTLRTIGRPLLLIWINQNAEKQIRATVISSYWQANACGQVVGSPFLGWIGTLVSLRAALSVGTFLYIGTLPVLFFAQRQWSAKAQRDTQEVSGP